MLCGGIGAFFLYLRRSIAAIWLALLVVLPYPAFADSDIFQPGLHPSRDKSHISSKTFSNQDLTTQARAIRNHRLSATQRALNHRWLAQHNDDDQIEGSKAFSRLLQRSFKVFWDETRKEKFSGLDYVPDSEGQGSINEMNYDIHMSSDEINFGLVYEFQ